MKLALVAVETETAQSVYPGGLTRGMKVHSPRARKYVPQMSHQRLESASLKGLTRSLKVHSSEA